jgi:hypothetical protein
MTSPLSCSIVLTIQSGFATIRLRTPTNSYVFFGHQSAVYASLTKLAMQSGDTIPLCRKPPRAGDTGAIRYTTSASAAYRLRQQLETSVGISSFSLRRWQTLKSTLTNGTSPYF